ncbi:hypothetical protein [Blastococcus sp. SYSU D01042]
MSGTTDSRAAVFTGSPQSVEVYQAGTWWSGELLGWRHDASGSCQMWVRVVVGGVEETAWIDLAALRLPGAAAPAPGVGVIDSRVKQELPTAQAVSALRGRARTGEPAATDALPLLRDEPAAAGAPAVDAPTVAVARPGGRRRAPETGEVPVLSAPAAVPAAASAGRHRAPADPGRHRAADTEVFAAVSDATAQLSAVGAEHAPPVEARRAVRPHAGAGWTVPAARSPRAEESYGRSEVCTGRIEVEPDLLTRPMRLSDLAPHARRPRVSGAVSGA